MIIESKEELLTCPVCGARANLHDENGYYVSCCSIDCNCKTKVYSFEELAVAEWNKSMRPHFKPISMTQFVKEDHDGHVVNRAYVLDKAKEIVHGQRNDDYGTPEDNFGLIAELWTPYIAKRCANAEADVCLLPADVANLMMLMKIARIATGTATEDSYIDIAGYAACGAECEFND